MSMTLKPVPPEEGDERTLLPTRHWNSTNCPSEVTQDISDSESHEFNETEAQVEGRLCLEGGFVRYLFLHLHGEGTQPCHPSPEMELDTEALL